MGRKTGLSFFLLVLIVGATLICSPAASPEQAHSHAESLQGSVGQADHPGTCEDDQPVLATAFQWPELLGRSPEASSPQEAHQAQEIGGRGPGRAGDLSAFLPGSFPPSMAPEKLYKLHLSYLI